MRIRHLLFFILLVAFAASGCIFSPDNDDQSQQQPPPECTVATSADAAMQVFRDVYAARNLDCYRKLLSRDYLFIDQDGGFDNYDDEIRIADKMFNGLEGDNQIIISDITIDRLEPRGVWTQTPANDPNFGGFSDSQYRQYIVDFSFAVSGQNLILRVQGPVLYYVEDVGESSPDFKILGMVDATYGN
jgi:hypothetical protein